MESIVIDSSNIKSPLFYDEDNKELLVFFKSGSFYKYNEITKDTIEKFKKSDNKTKYLKENLLRYTKIY